MNKINQTGFRHGWMGIPGPLKSLVFSVLLLANLSSGYSAQYVTLLADLETFSYKLDDLSEGAHPVRGSYRVTCTTGPAEWRINFSGTNWTQRWCFDGTNVYLELINSNAVPQRVQLGAGHEQTDSNFSTAAKGDSAQVSSTVDIWDSADGCPLGDSWVNIPWLAFCSGKFLGRPGRIVPLPVADLRHAPDGFAYADTTATFEDALGLPRSIDLRASEALFESSVMSPVFKGKHDVALWKRGSTGFKWDFPDGALRFRYRVISSTNIAGWHVSLHFEWSMRARATGKLLPLGEGRVLSARISEKQPQFLTPGLSRTVVDWRFQDMAKGIDGIVYESTNGIALPTNDPALQAEFVNRISRAVSVKRSVHEAR